MDHRCLVLVCLCLGLSACSRQQVGDDRKAYGAASAEEDAGASDVPETTPPPVPPQTETPPPASTGGTPTEACAVVDAASTLERSPVDIVWVVDDSGSMSDEQARIRENIARFATQIKGAGIDVHVVIVTESDLALNTALASDPNYLFVRANVGSHDSLEVLRDEFAKYRSLLRPTALTHFIAVTDDESDLPGQTFRTEMEALLGHTFTFHAIASESVNGRACRCTGAILCGAASPGDEYYALAAATSGEQVSICTLDWGAVFDRLIAAVVKGSPLPCTFSLPAAPAGSTLDPNKVKFTFDGAQGSSEIPRLGAPECGKLVAWQYGKGATSELVLCPSACEAISGGRAAHITLGCDPTVVVQ